jgi:PAS domain S-box-containing protein
MAFMDSSRPYHHTVHSVRTPLQHTEDRFRLLVEAVRDYAIFMLDPQGHVSTWNIGAQRLKGYSEAEIIGKHFSQFYPAGDRAARKPERELEIAAREGRLEDEGWRVRKDGSMFWANVVITALRDEDGELVGFGKVTRDVTERMRVHAALQKSNQELANEVSERTKAELRLQESESSLRRLSLHLLRTQDEERRRIGRDLHDSVGQYLAALKMNLDSLTSAIGSSDGEHAETLRQCVHLAQESIKEVRTISYLLYPPMLEETGLKSAVQWYLDGYAKRSGIETFLEIPCEFGRLPQDVELAVFRVLQESLTNVHRHSGSPTAHVLIQVSDGRLIMEVRDNGKGIPAQVLEEGHHDSCGALGVGLRGMKERIRQLGGELDFVSSPEGTTVKAMVPVESVA